MKSLLSCVVLIAVATSSQAGNLAEPIIEPDIVVEEAEASSNAGLIVPLLLLAIVAAAVSSSGNGGGVVISDARLKTDAVRIGDTAHGLPLYRYRYIGSSSIFEGVMAQDVARVRPDAVVRHVSGFLMVDYGKLGTTLREVR